MLIFFSFFHPCGAVCAQNGYTTPFRRWHLQGSTDDAGDKSGEMGSNLQAVPLGGAKAVAIAAGCDFTCAITNGDDVLCW